MADSHVPVAVSGLSAGVVAITASNTFAACAVTAAGAAECWGDNTNGTLGDGTTTSSLVPVPVTGLSSGVVGISANGRTTCAVTAGGAVQCWGLNDFGQIGNNNALEFHAPVAVAGLPPVVAVATGDSHVCVVTSTGGVKCWGANGAGQLGNNTTIASAAPVDVVGLSSGVAAVASPAGSSCALLKSGAVKCWGYRNVLGNDEGESSSVPVDMVGLASGVVAIGGGLDHMCALLATGGVKCWGNRHFGQLGDGITNDKLTPPVDVVGLSSGVIAISSGGASDHTCALLATGKIMCWGMNGRGQLGNNSTTLSNVPVEVVGY
jgi:alpha-tubulin suppressor-like RCC1 family protein